MSRSLQGAILLLPLLAACDHEGEKGLALTDVPPAVRDAFNARFPAATEVRWEREDSISFAVDFRDEQAQRSVTFDRTGRWLVSEMTIDTTQLPPQVRLAISRDRAGRTVNEIERVEHPEEESFYEVEFKDANGTMEVAYDADGTEREREVEGNEKD